MSNFSTVYLLFSFLALKEKKNLWTDISRPCKHSASRGNLASIDDSSLKQSLQWWLQNSDFPNYTTPSGFIMCTKGRIFFSISIYIFVSTDSWILTLFNGITYTSQLRTECAVYKKIRFYSETNKSISRKALGDTSSHFLYTRMSKWHTLMAYPYIKVCIPLPRWEIEHFLRVGKIYT